MPGHYDKLAICLHEGDRELTVAMQCPHARVIRYESQCQPSEAFSCCNISSNQVVEDSFLEHSLAMFLQSQSLVSWEWTVSLAEDPELVTVQVHGMVSFVEILDDDVHYFDSAVLNDKVVLFIVANFINSVNISH